MALPEDRERVRQILSDTIGLLCKNGLNFDAELSVDGLIGITIDRRDVLLISIKDTYGTDRHVQLLGDIDASTPPSITNSKKREKAGDINSKTSSFGGKSSYSSGISSQKSAEKCVAAGVSKVAEYPSTGRKRTTPKHDQVDDEMKKPRISGEAEETKTVTQGTVAKLSAMLKNKLHKDATVVTSQSASSDSNQLNRRPGSALEPVCNDKMLNSDPADAERGLPCNKASSLSEGNVRCSSPAPCLETKHFGTENDAQVSRFSDHAVENKTLKPVQLCAVSVGSDRTCVQQCSPPAHQEKDPGLSPIILECRSEAPYYSSGDGAISETQTVADKQFIGKKLGKHRLIRTEDDAKSDPRANCKSNPGSPASDYDVVCIKEEFPLSPSNSEALHADRGGSSLSDIDNLHEPMFLASSVDSLKLESLSYDQFSSMRDMHGAFEPGAKRYQGDMTCAWNLESPWQSSLEEPMMDDRQVKAAIKAILLYDGQYVPLRDIQRLRLCGMAAGQIKIAMEELSSHGGRLGCFQALHGGVNLFYKCPPNLVDRSSLENLYGITWEQYKFHFEMIPASNITTKHNEQYWIKVANGSPYITSLYQ